MTDKKQITFRIRRFDPDTDSIPHWDSYALNVPEGMTVLEALALAQGLSDFASRDRIVVLREVNGKTTEIPFNYRKIGDNGSQQNFFLRPGDIVVVP